MIVTVIGPTELEVSDFAESSSHVHAPDAGEGFGPLQMFATSLALCSASVLDQYARGPLATSTDALRLRVRWTYGDRPHRVASLEVEVIWPGLADRHLPAVRRAVESCTIHRTLEHPPAMAVRVRASERDSQTPSVPGPAAPESTPPPIARQAELPIAEATRRTTR